LSTGSLRPRKAQVQVLGQAPGVRACIIAHPCRRGTVVTIAGWALGAASLLVWVGLLVGRGLFWWPVPRLKLTDPRNGPSPSVIAVNPARNEAEILPETLPTVLAQTYKGELGIVLVDDRSEDGTSDVARTTAVAATARERVTILSGTTRPEGWMGKLWALQQGLVGAERGQEPDYIWFADADIAYEPWVLGALVARAEENELDLVSVMATLRVD